MSKYIGSAYSLQGNIEIGIFDKYICSYSEGVDTLDSDGLISIEIDDFQKWDSQGLPIFQNVSCTKWRKRMV